MKKPAITICIPTFNRAGLLEKTLQSVVNQTVKPFEVLIVDNASTDNTEEIVKKFRRYKFRYIRSKKNVGMIENWNVCIRKSRGDYLTFLHSDDLIAPDWNETWTKVIKKCNVPFYTSSLVIIDENNNPKYTCRTFSSNRLLKQPDVMREFWTHGSPGVPLTGATIFKKDLFKKWGMFNPKFKTEADVPMGYGILSANDVCYIDKLLFAYRSHSDQGFDAKQQKKNIKEELIRLRNYFGLIQNFYRERLEKEGGNRFFIQHSIMMNLAPVNLYVVKLQFKKILTYYRTALFFFPDLFTKPSDWLIFFKYQFIFIKRALLMDRIAGADQKELRWLKNIS